MTNRVDKQVDDMFKLLGIVEAKNPHAAEFRSAMQASMRPGKVDVTPIIRAVVKGFEHDPGHSDLDNEQPINVQMTLGDWRKARRLLYELEDLDEKRLAELERQSGCSDA